METTKPQTEEPISSAEPDTDQNNETWQANRQVILKAMVRLMNRHNRLPTKIEIAEETGLSRPTIYKHLKSLGDNPVQKEQMQLFGMYSSSVLAKIAQVALSGDIKAARLALELMGAINRK